MVFAPCTPFTQTVTVPLPAPAGLSAVINTSTCVQLPAGYMSVAAGVDTLLFGTFVVVGPWSPTPAA